MGALPDAPAGLARQRLMVRPMFDAQLLIRETANTQVLGPWFPRDGDNLIARAEVIEEDGAVLRVRVLTKNTQDVGDGTLITGAIAPTGVGVFSQSYPGDLKELVRYRYTLSGGAAGTYVLFRMLPPVWYDTV